MSIKKIIIILIIIAVISALVLFLAVGKKEKVEYITASVEKGSLLQTVSEVGIVKATQEIELNFLQTGKIAKVLVRVGEKIKKDQVLAELDYSSLLISEQEASASLDIAKANLDKLLSGATSHEIAVSQANVNQAKIAYLAALDELEKVKNKVDDSIKQAEKNLYDLESDSDDNVTPYEQAVKTAQTNLNNTKSTYQQSANNKKDIVLTTIENKLAVVNTALDNINTVLTDPDIKSVLSVEESSYLTFTENSYDSGLKLLAIALDSLSIAQKNKTDRDIKGAIDDCFACLNKVFQALDYCYSALENSITTSSFTQTELDTFKTNISTQSAAISTAISAVQTAEQNLDDATLDYNTNVSAKEDSLTKAEVDLADAVKTAKNSLSSAKLSGDQQLASAQTKVNTSFEAWEVAKTELAKIKSPARAEDISLVRAQAKQAEASLELVKKKIEDSIIKASIDGTIVKVDYEVGEQVIANKPFIAMLGNNSLEIEIDISEADIAKININNPVEITLDAFGDEIKFSGIVYFVEPAETIIQDVTYYKVKIQFKDELIKLDSVKPGMTANAIITTAQKDNVLIMPSRAVVEKNGGNKYVRVLINGQINEIPVEIGLRGDEGLVEVLSGVKEGDEVVTFINET